MRTVTRLLLAVALAAPALLAAQDGKALYEQRCAPCHETGINSAPRRGNAADWAPRLGAGRAAIYRSAIQGTSRGMPGRGGDPSLSDPSVHAAVDYLLIGSTGAAATTPAPLPAEVERQPVVVAAGALDSNAFNRLLKPVGRRNLPPTEDGIHDASVDGTQMLQPPLSAFEAMPRANAGNRVDWVKALEQRKIAPRWDRDRPDAAATVIDLNIVREVKGSMPDVVYPHKQHTEWLDCANCHPAIFVPQKGANQMSMASILLGQGCGTCHGKVAFPVSECRLCHSAKKDGAAPASRSAAAPK